MERGDDGGTQRKGVMTVEADRRCHLQGEIKIQLMEKKTKLTEQKSRNYRD